MEGFVFEFTGDSSGSADEIRLPHDFPSGLRRIVLRPPVGHAWTFYGPGAAKSLPLSMDETLTLGPAAYSANDVIGYWALDSGSGTGKGIAT